MVKDGKKFPDKKNMLELCKYISMKIDKNKVDDFEVFAAGMKSNDIEVYNANVEELSFSDTAGIGIRLIRDCSIGYAYTSILEENRIKDCIDRAFLNMKSASRDKYNSLPDSDKVGLNKDTISRESLYDENFQDYDNNFKIKLLKDLESNALSRDKRIKGINNLMYSDSISEVAIFNSRGFADSYRASACFTYLNVISEQDGDRSTGDYYGCDRNPGKINIEELASNAVKRSVSILSGEKIKSIKTNIILDPLVAAQFLGIIAGSLAADDIQKGKSLFKDMIGKKIFGLDLDIFDDGTLKNGLSSMPFDDEGIAKNKTVVFKKGVLKTYLHNTYTSNKDGTASTGNASRASYRSTPGVGASNFFILKSDSSFEELLNEMGTGLYVMDIIGLHSGVNPISGEISVGAKGVWVKNGTLDHPVNEVTIATDILSFCKSIDMVGDDIKFVPSSGYIGSPSLLVRDIMVAGK